ncbi:MAG: type II toxin-antitoxin system RelE/ParE family toxin [Acidobacteriia bacterium]|nr:type II toxin-antitoxin system RelE/ParE family toxin [Terriglobia bacterium]MYG03633.1 type II toxin-antitoxin system RelE/ParE family toxin [Terriglobia bacterium]MYK10273.1 type II toxin-antitoxin system RelE/ParE family toxin [Terriglobia bacterium]
MPFLVQLTDDAARDLEEICDYILHHDAPRSADLLLDQIERAIGALTEFPQRGAYPKELLEFGVREFREILFKPYRIIYRVKRTDVYELVVADGRRDMHTLLQHRLLEADAPHHRYVNQGVGAPLDTVG